MSTAGKMSTAGGGLTLSREYQRPCRTSLLNAPNVNNIPSHNPLSTFVPPSPFPLSFPTAELESFTLANGEPTPKSGKQEKFEQLINYYV